MIPTRTAICRHFHGLRRLWRRCQNHNGKPAQALNTVPCEIKLIFGTDKQGISTVSYDLELQISNRTGRFISHISVYWLNATKDIIGNSDAACGHVTSNKNRQSIAPGETGACRHTVQTVGGRLLDRLGQETWTNIINTEMRNFNQVRECAVDRLSFS